MDPYPPIDCIGMLVIGAFCIGIEVIGIEVIGIGAGAATGIAAGAASADAFSGALPATGRYDGVLKRRSSSCNASMYAACCLCEAINAFKSGPACVFTSSPTKIAQV